MKDIAYKSLKKFKNEFESDKQNKILQRSVIANGIYLSSRNPDAVNLDEINWTHEVKTGEISNQKNSGRCWIFAALVFAENQIAKKLKIDSIKLSKNYLYFYDKLEMTNSFYQNIIDTKDKDLSSRHVQEILKRKQYDAGTWVEAASLVEKYGVIPDFIMPETADSENSNQINTILNEKLAFDAKKIRSSNDPQKLKEKLLAENYKILALSFGTPPENFIFEYQPKNEKSSKNDKTDTKKAKKEKVEIIKSSPLEFWQKFGGKINDFETLEFRTDYKRQEMNKLYEEIDLDPIYGSPYISANVRFSDEIISSIKKQLNKDEPVYFGWDYGKQFSSKLGIVNSELWKYQELYGINFKLGDTDRGLYRDSSGQGGHATSIVGYHEEDDRITHFKVKNSWGTDSGKNGFIIMSPNYLNDYCTSLIIRKKYLPKEIREIFDQKPEKICYWD